MGRRVVALAAEDPQVRLIGGVESSAHPLIGNDLGTIAGVPPIAVTLGSDWPAGADAVIDFSLPVAVRGCVDACVKSGTPLVVATTGLEAEQTQWLAEAAKSIAVCWAPSMSLAVNLTMRLAQQVTAALKGLPGGIDVEIIERHHRFKEDAPSGTALKFGQIIATELEKDAGIKVQHQHGREGKTGARPCNEIGYHAVRVGDNPGEHTIVFGMLGERIELNVAASNRDCYATGAIAAAKWLQGKPPGMYDMFDVLGLNAASGK
ncbi:MAG: 4-hydroxy-tetrahydrodipicolinate reductase [Planctomycetaceae bacterium]